jgi:hypothetical protein
MASAPLGHGQLRRHPHQLLTGTQQLPLQPGRQLAAILHCPQSLPVERRRPVEQLIAADCDRLLRERSSCLVDGNSSHRLLVHVQSNNDHLIASKPLGATGERTDLNRGSEGHAPIRSRSTVSVGGGDTTLEGQTDIEFRNDP